MGLSGLTTVIDRAKYLLNENSTTILTGVGVAGTVVTAVLTGRATFKAAEIIASEEKFRRETFGDKDENVPDLTRMQKVKIAWKPYISPVISGGATIAAIIGANRIASKKIAALTFAAGISERALQEYKDKIAERFGKNEHTKMRDEIAQARVQKNPVESQEVIIVGTGEVLFFDNATGRYFQSTVENVRRAENKINYEIIHFMNASLSEFYDEIGLPATAYTDSVGFNTDNLLKVEFSSTISTDGRPCIVIDFANPPISGYHRWDGM